MIKERNRLDIYGYDWDSWIERSRAEAPGLSNDELESIHGISIPDELGIKPAFPIAAGVGGVGPWESWVYTQVGGGMEIVFTDEVGSGRFNYAPPPPISAGSSVLSDLGVRATHYSPGYVLQQAATTKPDHFTLPPGVKPFEFYYDVATFRGRMDTLDEELVEVYFGIPPEQLVGDGTRQQVVLTRTVAIATQTGEIVRRLRDRMVFPGLQALAGQRGAFIPELAATGIPPGDYRLAVELTDAQTGRWGIYQQDLKIVSYRDSLGISDIEMAWIVSQDARPSKFKKTSYGDPVQVIPMASRSYRMDQSVHLYYEVYNLKKDAFGRTKYDVTYTIKQDTKRQATLFGGVAKLFDALFTNRKPQFSVSYEHSGDLVNESVYIEFETSKLKRGVNQVEIVIRDLLSGGEVSKRALFRLDKADADNRITTAGEDLAPDFMDNPESRGRRRRRR